MEYMAHAMKDDLCSESLLSPAEPDFPGTEQFVIGGGGGFCTPNEGNIPEVLLRSERSAEGLQNGRKCKKVKQKIEAWVERHTRLGFQVLIFMLSRKDRLRCLQLKI